jgi:hypothetical protein
LQSEILCDLTISAERKIYAIFFEVIISKVIVNLIAFVLGGIKRVLGTEVINDE